MMKRWLWVAFTTILFTAFFGNAAFASTSLELVSGGSTVFVTDGGAVVCSPGACAAGTPANDQSGGAIPDGAISLAGFDFGGFHITITAGGSNSPLCSGSNGPGCMNTTNITATSIGAATLKMFFASTGFTPTSNLIVGFSTPGETGTTATQQAYATAGVVNPLASGNLNPIGGLSACGPLLTINGPTGNTSQGSSCPSPGSPYSLELATTMTATGAGQAFNLNGTISNVPEPAAIALFGTVLALCASGLRRKRKVS